MRRRSLAVVLIGVTVVLAGLGYALSQFSLSALNDPGVTETYLATTAKRWLVKRGARGVGLPRVEDAAAGISNGRLRFGGSCAFCHGFEGRAPIEVGLWMYPRAPDLGLAPRTAVVGCRTVLDHQEWHPHDRHAGLR